MQMFNLQKFISDNNNNKTRLKLTLIWLFFVCLSQITMFTNLRFRPGVVAIFFDFSLTVKAAPH